ncbi:hypothetical protein MIN45_P1613 [Methylomarinovum tepidoasis]|uniref:Membrane fusion protein biotin-lipoyl like domain-containing protein n=1 Tax=Methylomarinovum tepidoasis TaxID=2840183 RepID=A0AAU9CIQ8_9GAMM|nr:hypothetical protein MIN45_P1613 [Methylomarinovum sp. IN45]
MKRWSLMWLVLLADCGEQKPAESLPETAIAVTVTPAAQADLEIWEESVGGLEAVNAPRLAAEVAGRIVATRAEMGDRVTPGQTLARIDSGDYRLARDLARAEIARLQALLKEARLKVQRLRHLVGAQIRQPGGPGRGRGPLGIAAGAAAGGPGAPAAGRARSGQDRDCQPGRWPGRCSPRLGGRLRKTGFTSVRPHRPDPAARPAALS